MSGATAFPAAAIVSGVLSTSRLGSGSPSSTNFLRGDGAWETVDTSVVPLVLGTNQVEQRNGVSPQAFRVYNTYTDASNYERGFLRWDTNLLELGVEAAGTGVVNRGVRVLCGSTGLDVLLAGTSFFKVNNGNILINAEMRPASSASFDLGRAANAWRDLYLRPSASLTPTVNGLLCIEATSNTAITLKFRGSDGTVRSGVITLS